MVDAAHLRFLEVQHAPKIQTEDSHSTQAISVPHSTLPKALSAENTGTLT